MEVTQILHMNRGEGESSYAKNSALQAHSLHSSSRTCLWPYSPSVRLAAHGCSNDSRFTHCPFHSSRGRGRCKRREIISHANSILEEAVSDSLLNTLPQSMGIADLGCSSGANTFVVITKVINTVYATSDKTGISMPELRISLNDLPCNDFNDVFTSLPEFYDKIEKENGIGKDDCFVSGVAGSFYGRLFPKNSMHFVHSSSSLHWLSKVPHSLASNTGKHLNEGKIYISKTSPDCVVKAYLSQFQMDFSTFLTSRAKEIVAGGQMVLSFMGRNSPEASAEVGSYQWELLARALMSMANQGLIKKEKVDSFNAPYYAPSREEVMNVIELEASFGINHIVAFEIGWDEGSTNCSYGKNVFNEVEKLSRGRKVAKTIRAVVESMLEAHFGREIMDELFRRYGEVVDDYISSTKAKYINLVVSVTRK